jgi:hypothetical protein
MIILGSLYEFAADAGCECTRCGWRGASRGLVPTIFSRENLAAFDCPVCAATLVWAPVPTLADVRAAAADGNARAQADLQAADEHEQEQAAMHATELLTVDELPDLGLISPTVFVWDQEREADRNEWTVIRTAESGRLVWRERAYWEGYGRFSTIRLLLAQRYKSTFADLVSTDRACFWLGGDLWAVALSETRPPRVATASEAPWIQGFEDGQDERQS